MNDYTCFLGMNMTVKNFNLSSDFHDPNKRKKNQIVLKAYKSLFEWFYFI